MTKERPVPIKAHKVFRDKLIETKYLRVSQKLDETPVSLQELTFRMTKFEPLWDILKKAKFVKDKNGQMSPMFNLFTISIIAFMTVIMFGGLIWVSGILNNTFHNIGLEYDAKNNPSQPGYVNLTRASDNTFGAMNNSIQALRLVAICMIFSLILGTIIANSMIKVHPALFFVYMLIVILAVIFAAPISNAYLSILNTNIYDGILGTFTGSDWFLLHLPLMVAITGILGSIFLFINIIRVGNEGTL